MAIWICNIPSTQSKIMISVLTILLIIGYKGESMAGTKIISDKINNVSEQKLGELSKKKIFFGHRSVGENILDGIKDIILDNPKIKFNIKETRESSDFEYPVFAHSGIGKNGNPASKIDDFKSVIEKGVGNKVDMAFFKFCFVDVNAKTNLDELFNYYTKTISTLESEYPKVKFIHFTVPLTTIQTGIKAEIKKLVGRPLDGVDDNIKRNLFNQMLIKKYSNKVFDLARLESTFPNGKKNEFTKKNARFAYLIQEYSDDGGHLNNTGRKIAALGLVEFLISVLD